jgi:hypothetical protein
VEGIKLPGTLALLLRADLRGPAEREGEGVLEYGLTFHLAADSRMILLSRPRRMRNCRLNCLAWAPTLPRSWQCENRIAEPDAVASRQAIEPFDDGMQQLGIGRKGDGLRLHRGVDRDPLEILAA